MLFTPDSPISQENMENLLYSLPLKDSSVVIDIGSGYGDFLIQLAKLYSIQGFGFDKQEKKNEIARKKAAQITTALNLEFFTADVTQYDFSDIPLCDMASCVGAWNYAWGQDSVFVAFTNFLKSLTKPEGLILIGIPYWTGYPFEEYCEKYNVDPNEFVPLKSYVEQANELDLDLLYVFTASKQELDLYHNLMWLKQEESGKETDIPADEVDKRYRSKLHYVEGIRQLDGWCLLLFRK